jgi:putative DNA-invertase from lambdoid prophage Rac
MGRVFAYCRVSTNDQNPENQKLEILNSGFSVEPKRFVEEKISGSVYASRRPEFIKLLDRLEEGDSLVVTKLDRLGRNALDVRQTIDLLAERGVKVHCLALGSTDLTSSSGKMTMTILSAVAEFERDLIIERTQSGLVRAKAEGKKLGRRFSLSESQQQAVIADLAAGKSVSETARKFNTSRQTILRTRELKQKGLRGRAIANS